MNNKIIILLILIVFIFIIIDCNCKEGFSIGGPNYVLIEVGTNRVIDDNEAFGGQNLVSASNIDGAKNIFETDHGIDFDDHEYQVKLQSEPVDVDASDTVPEPSPDFEFEEFEDEDEEDDELADLYESGTLLGRCKLSENDIIKGECEFIKDLNNYVTIMMTIVEHVKPFTLEDDDPGIHHDWLDDTIQEYIDNAIFRKTQVNHRIRTLKEKLSTLDESSDDYKLLYEIKEEYTTKYNIVNDQKSLLESYREEI